jgi:hypothetical protein
MIRLRPEQVWTCNVNTSPPSAPLASFTFMTLLAAVTNSEPHGVTLAGYCYGMRHGMKVKIVTPYHVSHLQRYGVTVRGNVTSVYPPECSHTTGSMNIVVVSEHSCSNRRTQVILTLAPQHYHILKVSLLATSRI